MNKKDRVKLRFGPYRTPRFKRGDVVYCERCGEVTLCGLSSGRIPWPTCRRGKAKAIVLCAGLADAVRRESAVAVQHWWGVGRSTVLQWRKALGVGRQTHGTWALQSDYAKEPRMDAIRARAVAKARDPERRAKISAARRERPPSPKVLQALHEGNRGRHHSKATRRKMSVSHKRRGTRPPHGRAWTPAEDALVRSFAPSEAASRTGRTLRSVIYRRRALNLPDGRRSNGKVPRGGPWSGEEDTLVRTMPAAQVAERTGRTLREVYRRRQKLRGGKRKLPDGRATNGRKPK
jgi:hypothetical protein